LNSLICIALYCHASPLFVNAYETRVISTHCPCGTWEGDVDCREKCGGKESAPSYDPLAAQRQQEAIEQQRLEEERKRQIAVERKRKLAEEKRRWQEEFEKGKVEALQSLKEVGADGDIGFKGIEPDPEFGGEEDEVAASAAAFALNHEMEIFRDRVVKMAENRVKRGEITQKDLDKIKLGRIHTRIPVQGSMDKDVYRERLNGSLKKTRAWLEKATGGTIDRCFVYFDGASGTCVDEGTVAGLRACFKNAIETYNNCTTIAK
jgi:hypothetical protein